MHARADGNEIVSDGLPSQQKVGLNSERQIERFGVIVVFAVDFLIGAVGAHREGYTASGTVHVGIGLQVNAQVDALSGR